MGHFSKYCATLCALVFSLPAFPVENTSITNKPHGLLMTQSKGFVHEVVKRRGSTNSIVEGIWKKIAESSGEFFVETSDDISSLTSNRLDHLDFVVFFTTGDLPWNEPDFAAFDKWLKEGRGFIGIHCASDTLKNHTNYTRMLGGIFDGHPWNQNETVFMKVHDRRHPAMKMIPEEGFQEELYRISGFDTNGTRVLMTLDMERTPLKKPYAVPVAWCRYHGKGRIFYTSLGHREDVWRKEWFQSHLLGAVRWATNLEAQDLTANPWVFHFEDQLAKLACNEEPDFESPTSPNSVSRMKTASVNTNGFILDREDPWVFRSVLNEFPRIITISLGKHHWLAYDTTDCGLYQFWKGGVELEGAVHDNRHGPQPWSRGLVFQRQNRMGLWRAFRESQPIGLKPRYQGYVLKENQFILRYQLHTDDGSVIHVEEEPALPDSHANQLSRKMTIRNLPDAMNLKLKLSGEGWPDDWNCSGNGRLERIASQGNRHEWFVEFLGNGTSLLTGTWTAGRKP